MRLTANGLHSNTIHLGLWGAASSAGGTATATATAGAATATAPPWPPPTTSRTPMFPDS